MDVTRSNLSHTLPLIEHAVADCDFVSIDEEFSGLRKGRGGHVFDLQSERYQKMRDASIGYSIIQFGLTCFRRTDRRQDGQQVFQYQSFNIFIFPYKVQGLPRHLERNVEMQASAVSFLRSHGFDFNRLFDEGISYLTLKEETECRQALYENDQRTNQYVAAVPDDLRDFVDETVDQVDSFLDEEESQRLDLPPCTAFKRKLVYQALSGDKYRSRLSIESLPVSSTGRDFFLSITKSTADTKREKANAILTEASGFSRILQIISKCKKPLVGHNLFLDIMHIVAQFLTDLPDTYEEFKDVVHSMFPHLYDTKYIASTLALKKLITSSTLEDLRETLSHKPFKPVIVQQVQSSECTMEHGDEQTGSKYHQAGYDSFITGHCFILMNNFLQETLSPKSGESDEVIGSEIRRYVNRLNLTYSFDLDHYYMGGEEVRPQRKHVYHVSFPSDWNTQSLTQLFSPYGSVQINWINDTSAFVGLKDATRAHSLNKSLSAGRFTADAGVQMTPYDEFRTREEQEVTGNSVKRSSDQLAAEVRTEQVTNEQKHQPASEESGKRVKRAAGRESGKKSLQTPFPEEKDW